MVWKGCTTIPRSSTHNSTPHIPLEHVPLYHEAQQECIDHNAVVNNGRTETADAMGWQMLAQLVNEIKPNKVPHPQIKIDMPEYYEGDPAEIDKLKEWVEMEKEFEI